MKSLRRWIRRQRRMLWATDNYVAFRMGYYAALRDTEKVRPLNDEKAREMADRALERLVKQ